MALDALASSVIKVFRRSIRGGDFFVTSHSTFPPYFLYLWLRALALTHAGKAHGRTHKTT